MENTLKQDFKGTLISDGYATYTSYIEKNKEITHAQCRVHSRRKFIEAETEYPDRVKEALAMIATLYKEEERIEAQGSDETSKRERRLEKSKPVVDRFVEWCQQQLNLCDLRPSSPLRKALNYVISRETELRVLLEEPNVPLDTNHLERALRPIPMGRKNWLFCWTEVGAEHVGIIQSLICTCKQHKINPYTYLTNVLLRINQHPASQVEDLTSRLWEEKFAENPLRSELACQ
ncbi:IS66 family transposase [Oceanospirillum sp. D5]|uniref:IS66 family transposase n=1 Tax=Oceanospirillum sediminis TaxID=2760088 RepID=A0A839IMA3_9GAMM|nr:IS66 family transposase [Oceanospirillum sediminis]